MSRLNPKATRDFKGMSPYEMMFGEVIDEKELKTGFVNFVKYQSSKPNFDLPPIDTMAKLPIGQEQNFKL